MQLQSLLDHLSQLDQLEISLPDGALVPAHFHVTEVGEVTKRFIDCGGKVRNERTVSLQLWSANDYDHRLHPEKLVHIVELAQKQLGIGNAEVEVEFQGERSIEKFGLKASDSGLQLTGRQTACLALEECGPVGKAAFSLKSSIANNVCTPGGGCC